MNRSANRLIRTRHNTRTERHPRIFGTSAERQFGGAEGGFTSFRSSPATGGEHPTLFAPVLCDFRGERSFGRVDAANFEFHTAVGTRDNLTFDRIGRELDRRVRLRAARVHWTESCHGTRPPTTAPPEGLRRIAE